MDCIKEAYKQVIDAMAIVSKTDVDGTIIYVNDKFCELSGYNQDELIGQKQSIIKHPDTLQSTYKDMWETITQKQIWHGTIKNRKKDNSEYYVRLSIYPILDKDDNIIEYMSFAYIATQEILKEKTKNKKIIDTKTNLVEKTRSQTAELESQVFELTMRLRKATSMIDTLSKSKKDGLESKIDKAYVEIDSLKKELKLKEREASMSQLNFTRKEKEIMNKLNNLKNENMDLKSRNDQLVHDKKRMNDTINNLKNAQHKKVVTTSSSKAPKYKDDEKQKKLAIKGLFG
jgi:PAS domain S-box-containing protein